MKTLKRITNLFRCRHDSITWPLKDKATNETTVVCQRCHRRLTYSWESMKVTA